jgi:hypothetical protein
MNIVEAFNKLKENPDIVIRCKDMSYTLKNGWLYYSEFDGDLAESCSNNSCFLEIEQILSKDWEVVE